MPRLLLWTVAALASAVAMPAAASDRPNMVWIMSEDNSVHYLRHFDPDGAPAPHIETLAREGITFDRAFSCSPVCSVARTTLITGCFAPRVGTQFHRRGRPARLPEGLRMFPAYLRDAGYHTTNRQKEDYNAVPSTGVWDESSGQATWRDRPTTETPFFHVRTFTVCHESSLHFSRASMQEQPTATDPDSIRLPPYHPDTPLLRYTHARYHDRIIEMDAQVGDLIAELEEDGLLEETFIFYFGDHGGVLPRSKGYLFEGGLHVPLVVRIPERWQDRVALAPGTRTEGFVSFIDFGPTVLHLAGVAVPEGVDGRPFLGPDVTAEDLASRDEAFGYADRFDEKYDLSRSLRQGRWKYIRHYQPFYPDALQNNYRYQMLAYQQWRQLARQGELNDAQRAFFTRKPVEALYDLQNDPHEVDNLVGDPAHRGTLLRLRERLGTIVREMPDLSFFPESDLIERAMDDPVEFGQRHAAELIRCVDIADLSLLPFSEAAPEIRTALDSPHPWERRWALIACSGFGRDAAPLVPDARRLLEDPEPLVRLRAAEFLGIAGAEDPRPRLVQLLRDVDTPFAALEILNTVVYFHDRDPDPLPIDPRQLELDPQLAQGEVQRRIEYLQKVE